VITLQSYIKYFKYTPCELIRLLAKPNDPRELLTEALQYFGAKPDQIIVEDIFCDEGNGADFHQYNFESHYQLQKVQRRKNLMSKKAKKGISTNGKHLTMKEKHQELLRLYAEEQRVNHKLQSHPVNKKAHRNEELACGPPGPCPSPDCEFKFVMTPGPDQIKTPQQIIGDFQTAINDPTNPFCSVNPITEFMCTFAVNATINPAYQEYVNLCSNGQFAPPEGCPFSYHLPSLCTVTSPSIIPISGPGAMVNFSFSISLNTAIPLTPAQVAVGAPNPTGLVLLFVNSQNVFNLYPTRMMATGDAGTVMFSEIVTPGEHEIYYSGDSNYASCYSPASLVIDASLTTQIALINLPQVTSLQITLIAKVQVVYPDLLNSFLAFGNVTFHETNGQTMDVTVPLDSNGEAKNIQSFLAIGNYAYIATYNGYFVEGTAEETVSVSNTVKFLISK